MQADSLSADTTGAPGVTEAASGIVAKLIGWFEAFILLLPIFLDNALPPLASLLHLPFTNATVSHIQMMVFGALIIFFLIAEPHGLARLWQIAKEKLRLWPFPH